MFEWVYSINLSLYPGWMKSSILGKGSNKKKVGNHCPKQWSLDSIYEIHEIPFEIWKCLTHNDRATLFCPCSESYRKFLLFAVFGALLREQCGRNKWHFLKVTMCFVCSTSEIPQFRLPYAAVDFEIQLMLDLGVKVRRLRPRIRFTLLRSLAWKRVAVDEAVAIITREIIQFALTKPSQTVVQCSTVSVISSYSRLYASRSLQRN